MWDTGSHNWKFSAHHIPNSTITSIEMIPPQNKTLHMDGKSSNSSGGKRHTVTCQKNNMVRPFPQTTLRSKYSMPNQVCFSKPIVLNILPRSVSQQIMLVRKVKDQRETLLKMGQNHLVNGKTWPNSNRIGPKKKTLESEN